MRLPIAIGGILVASLSLNAPVMSLPPTHGVKTEITNSNLTQLRINRQLWNRQKINNYRYKLSNNCFCLPDFRGSLIIEVRNGITKSITNTQTGKPVNSELLQQYSTIPKLFNLIRNTINGGESELTVVYNPREHPNFARTCLSLRTKRQRSEAIARYGIASLHYVALAMTIYNLSLI